MTLLIRFWIFSFSF